MKELDHQIRVVPSLLDRLIDLEPRITRDVIPTRAESVRSLRRAVQRDVDNLLNTRNTFADLSPDFEEVTRSVLAYGLPDFSAFSQADARGRQRLRQIIETTIRTYEPRLTGVVATIDDASPDMNRPQAFRLRIDARLVMDPSPEPVSFDIVMPLHSSKYEVKERE
jgi:type VI secretion system protein ImpF